MQFEKVFGMWTPEIILNSEAEAIMKMPTCLQWPKLCWVFLKTMCVIRILGLDRHQFLWFSVATLILSIYIAVYMYKRKQQKIHVQIIHDEQQIQWRYEQSMDNLLSSFGLELNDEPPETTCSDTQISQVSSIHYSPRKSQSLTSTPRRDFDEFSDACSVRSNSSCSQCAKAAQAAQAALNKRRRIPIKRTNNPNRARQFALLPDFERGRFSQQLAAMIARSRKAPMWRN